MRIIVTNDDGINSLGLHVLARAMRSVGKVVVVAPDQEYSGCGAALGPTNGIEPEVHRAYIDGVDEVWAVTGPPALCAVLSCLEVFDGGFDLLVSGVNPGANVGRAVYHSGTIGACFAARNCGISGVAVSQAVGSPNADSRMSPDSGEPDGSLVSQNWDAAAEVATALVSELVAALPRSPVVMNVNIPNCRVEDIAGWRLAEVRPDLPLSEQTASLESRPRHTDSFRVRIRRGAELEQPAGTDAAIVMAGMVSVSWLSQLGGRTAGSPAQAAAESALDRMFC